MTKIKSLKELTNIGEIINTEISFLKEFKTHFTGFRTNEELSGDAELKVNWLIDGLLLEGGTSLIVAEPKTGKSVLARQLAYSISKGLNVLNRKSKQGLVFYFSVEDHPAWVKQHMKDMGADKCDSIYWSFGRITGLSFAEGIELICSKLRPSLIVLDTMFKVFRVNDINDYNSMIEELQKVSEIVRKYGTHLMYIHHVNKGGYSRNRGNGLDSLMNNRQDVSLNRIMGSMGIVGEVDNVIFLTKDADLRYLNTVPRCGDIIENELLFWDDKRKVYLINDI